MPGGSKIFAGFRALGLTSNHIPLAVRRHQKHDENYVVTCVGKAFHVYNCSKLGIVSVSNLQEEDISCLSVDAYLVFIGCKKEVKAFGRKGRELKHTYTGHENDVHTIIPFGNHLVTVDEGSCTKIWNIKTEELYTEIQFDPKSFQVTAVVHPSTYLNKILFASKQGLLQLWNIKSNKLLYTFQGWSSPICTIEQAPAVDVVGIGLADGRIILHNIKYDETLIKFTQEWGPVIAMSFRTDGQPIMVTGSSVGHIAIWNLDSKKLQSQVRDAHQGVVSGMQCLPGEPLMITSSPDNSLKVWIFDQPDGGARLLQQRSGHSAPPNKIRFYDYSGHNILSAGQDSTLRSFSTVHDRHNKSLGRASYNKALSKKTGLKKDLHMMPSIIDFSSESSRESDWDNVLACHRGEKLVTTWNVVRSSMGSYKLQHDRFSDVKHHRFSVAQCTTVSSCGNFGLIGYSSGEVDVYNMQSGLYRGGYGNTKAHKGPVRGVAVDGLNQVVVTAGADCCVRFWKFKSKELLSTLDMESQVSKLLLHRESSMLAVSLDNFKIVIVDLDTRRVVRIFSGHRNTVMDMTFSPDGRWLITSSMDCSLRTWDLPTGRLIDCGLFDAAVTSVTMSPTGDFLATSHVDDLGIYLWSNKTLYTHVPLRPLPLDYEPEILNLPSASLSTTGLSEAIEDEDSYTEAEFKSPEQISNELVTLSLLPNTRWKNLLDLEIIKLRNKAKEPPKVPKSAPFFLPTVPGLEFKFATPEESTAESSGKVHKVNFNNMSQFGQLLHTSCEKKEYKKVMDCFKEMGPSAIDVELRLLSPDAGGSLELMECFLDFIDNILKTNQDFELAQAYLGLFLKLHGDMISEEKSILEHLRTIQTSQQEAWHNLQNMFNQSLCLVNFFKSAVL